MLCHPQSKVLNPNSIPSAFIRGLFVLLAVLLAAPALAQDLGLKAPSQGEPIVIQNATIHTISGETIEGGWIYFVNGRIEGLGKEPLPRFATPVRIIDGAGKHVYPGLFSPYSQLGLTEIQSVRATLDMSETGQVTPEVRAIVAINPDSTLFPVTRSNGVLLAAIFPTGGLIPGRAGIMRLDGWTYEDMTVDADAGMVINWPFSRPISAPWMDQSEDDQQRDIDRNARILEEFITAARSYASARAAEPTLPTDLRFEAMRPLFAEGTARWPLLIAANDADQIRAAVSFCVKHDLKCVIVGGRDAPACAELLKRHDVPVVLSGGTFRFPRRNDGAYDEPFTLPARLEAAGITWTMAHGDDTAHERNLPYAAAIAVAYGLSHEAALRAITLSPARIYGIADRYGSLETGKSATLFIADGDILEIATNVEACFIDGRAVDMDDKHKALERKYRERYKQLGETR
jgi:imidazolonepropionase-like amidohydrolase